jgi:hypothetical protein
MDHVKGDHCVKRGVVLHAPCLAAHIDGDRRTHIGEVFGADPSLYAGARIHIWIARQPDEPGQCLGEADDMLPSTRSDFEREAFIRKNASQHLSNWAAIARG